MAACCLGLPSAVHAQSKTGWGENQAQALQKAKAENKLVLLDFTGSDWCSWCQKMDKEVFSTPDFLKYAQQHLELVEVDFPHAKSLPADVTKQNEGLQKEYAIEGFPTIVILNADGKKVGEFEGYQEGGAQAFIDQLAKLPKS
jgi:thioredoxin-related protein